MKTTLLASAALALIFASTQASAQDRDDRPGDVEAVFVTATRTPDSIENIAAPVSVLTFGDLTDRNSTTVFDSLDRLPGVSLSGGPRPEGETISIRGASGRQVIRMIDGARISPDEFLTSTTYVNPEFLVRAEVLRGSASAFYGPGGLGGVVAFETISALNFLDAANTIGGFVRVQGQSGSELFKADVAMFGRTERFDGLVAVGYRESGDIREGGGRRVSPSAGTDLSLLVKGGMAVTDDIRLEGSYQEFNNDSVRPNNAQAGTGFPFIFQNKIDDWKAIVDLSNDQGEGPLSWNLRAYRSQQIWSTIQNVNGPGFTNDNTIDGLSLNSTYALVGDNFSQRFIVGAEYIQDYTLYIYDGQPDSTSPEGDQVTFGFYLGDEVRFGRLTVTPVVRFDRYITSLASGAVADVTTERLSPQVALSWRFNESLMAYVSYGEAYRAPTVGEMYQELTGDTWFVNFAPNPNLGPETSRDWNVGLKFSRSLAGGSLFATVDVFRSDIDNLIAMVEIGTYVHPFFGLSSIYQNQNILRAERKGGELALEYQRGNLSLGLGFSTIRVTNAVTGDGQFSPPDKTTFSVGYRFNDQFEVGWQSRFVAAQDYDAEVTRRRPAWDTHDIFVAYRDSQGRFEVNAGVTNIFDKRYRDYKGSSAFDDIYEEGRSLRVRLSVPLGAAR